MATSSRARYILGWPFTPLTLDENNISFILYALEPPPTPTVSMEEI